MLQGYAEKSKEKRVDYQIIEKRREFLGLEKESLTAKEIKRKHEDSVDKWYEFKEKGAKEREKELLDACLEEITGDSKASRKRRKSLLKNTKKVKFCQHAFNMLSRHVEKERRAH